MLRHSVRRWLAATAVAAAIVTLAAVPAAAAGQLRLASRDVLVAPGHSALGQIDVRFDGYPAPHGVPVTLEIDAAEAAALGGFEVTAGGWQCTRDRDLVRCTTAFDRWGYTPRLYYQVSARADAALAEEAELTFTVTSTVGTATRSSTATVVEGVDLQTEPRTTLRGAPGARFELSSTVRNAGPGPADGAVLVLTADWLLEYAGNFRNCRHLESRPTICRFDTELRPGATYRLSAPLPLVLNPTARSGLVLTNRLQWWTPDDWALAERAEPGMSLPPDTPGGTGEELRLVEQPATRQTDTAPWNNWTAVDLTVTGDQTADVAAIGSSVRARVGERVPVTAAYHNLGPTRVEIWRTIPLLRVRIPEGTTAVEVTHLCAPIDANGWPPVGDDGEPGAREYGCHSGTDFASAGERFEFAFTLRVDRLTGPTSGTVTVDVPADTNPANDTARITVTPGNGGTGGSGGDGGDGGSLPITGASTGLIAGLGALLLAAGLTGYLLTRGRRTRFIA
ncbi:cell wall anchor protein [Micromonospora sp. C28SCA-DRY-2]|uniref:cell wall anchor protein n=1 Tax=Micromonospora sp. C28SCA-DRY-2 TaxID=3059522 RepID=UPI0026774BCF|nr:cell wall anchor protein [Micromonospora sp. C28SCA-DRY-2]MDO3706041.1 cell wall anchor protein [Micromonospora sp. C28SCA-DRY-2]